MVRWSLCLVLAVVTVGCSSSEANDESSESSVVIAWDDESDPEAASPDTAGAATGEDSSVEPLRPYDDSQTTTTTGEVDRSAYLSRVTMSNTSIELTWSDSEEAATYQIHRLPFTEDEPPVEAMTAENIVHNADDGGRFIDDTVEVGARYWYGIRHLTADGVVARFGWHRADAVTDTEPPTKVKALQAVPENGEVLVTWEPPDENYELHGYTVLRSVNDEELESISTTWRLEQRSFIDDRPPSGGNVTYAIVAFDFHWNDSEPAKVEVDLTGN